MISFVSQNTLIFYSIKWALIFSFALLRVNNYTNEVPTALLIASQKLGGRVKQTYGKNMKFTKLLPGKCWHLVVNSALPNKEICKKWSVFFFFFFFRKINIFPTLGIKVPGIQVMLFTISLCNSAIFIFKFTKLLINI